MSRPLLPMGSRQHSPLVPKPPIPGPLGTQLWTPHGAEEGVLGSSSPQRSSLKQWAEWRPWCGKDRESLLTRSSCPPELGASPRNHPSTAGVTVWGAGGAQAHVCLLGPVRNKHILPGHLPNLAVSPTFFPICFIQRDFL